MTTISVRVATAEDIASILLLCAPENILDDCSLLNEGVGEFVELFNELNSYDQVNVFAEALYYVNNPAQYKKDAYDIAKELYIPQTVVKALIQLTKNIAFSEDDDIYTTIADENQLKPSKKGKAIADENWDPYKRSFDEKIKEGMKVAPALKEIVDEIGAFNKELYESGKQTICINKNKNKNKNFYPSIGNARKQLVTNRK